jgi:hypothetical protein
MLDHSLDDRAQLDKSLVGLFRCEGAGHSTI